jgi:lipopolysaccharide export system protein LptC
MLKKIFHHIPLPWILVLLLIGLFFGFSFRPYPEQQKEINEDTSGFPQLYMKDVTTREFDVTGKLRYQLTTPIITHYQLNLNNPGTGDYTLIEQPALVFHQEKQAPWNITAKQGRSDHNGEVFRLLDNVVISQESKEQGLVEIMTESLIAKPLEQFVETDKAVKIRAKHTQIDAIGMHADLARSQLQLNSQVDAIYEPRF